MWHQNQRLAAIRMAELRAEADRLRLVRHEPGAAARILQAMGRATRMAVARVVLAAGRGAIAIGSSLDATAASSEFPAGMFGGQGHNR